MSGAIDSRQRLATIEELDGTAVDVAVIGGGITGVGCALDAASRGLSVALFEQRDFAAGTSSRSSKLIHGGLRYLEQLNFGLVFEAIQERSLLTDTLAPHLVHPVSFLYPLRHRVWERLYVGAGVLLYDLFSMRRRNSLPKHRHLSARGVARIAPGLDRRTYVGAIRYWDSQVDDARHTLAVARTAAQHGARMLTSTRVTGLRGAPASVTGVEATCLETGRRFGVDAEVVINATGVWTDDLQELVDGSDLHVRASKGIHLVVPRDVFDSESGVILRTEKSVLFIIPWGDHWIIGTTDTEWTLDRDHPAASAADIDYLLERVNAAVATSITRDDVQGVYAGLRPLLSGESEETSRLSREHAVVSPVPGLVTVAGGKYTTYRVMAADAVDAAAAHLSRDIPPSGTAAIPLVGADGYSAVAERAAALASSYDLPDELVDELIGRHGACAEEVLALIDADPSLGRPLAQGHHYLRAEVAYAVRAEGALHLDDVLTRRTRLSIESYDRGTDVAADVAAIMGGLLGWDTAAVTREIEHYGARVRAERESQTKPDDDTADAARLGAPDVRRGSPS